MVLESLLTLLGLMRNSERFGFPTFVVLGKGRPALTNSIMRLGGGCKALPVSWFDGLARIFSKVEDTGVWPEGLLDAYIAMIPKTDGDATPLGQRPLSVLPIVYRVWASVRMGQLEDWFKSWVPESVFSAGGGRGSVEAWYTYALDIEEVWFRFRMLRRFLAYRPGEAFRVYRLLEHVAGGCPGLGPVHLLVESAAEIGFVWSPEMVGWARGVAGLEQLGRSNSALYVAILDR